MSGRRSGARGTKSPGGSGGRASAKEAREREIVEPLIGEGTEVGWALRAVLTRFGDVVRHVANELEMPVTDVTALEQLMQDGTLGPAELAVRLGITSASTTVLLDRLERAGHVVRKPHPEDGRRRVLEVTAHARAEALAVLAPLFLALERNDRSFSKADQAVIERYLRGVVGVYDAFIDGRG